METLINSTLSDELQELYLENKEWLSDILFLEDEMRFFKNLFDQVLSGKIERENLQQLEMISASLNVILERRKQLKNVLECRKSQLEQLLGGNAVKIEIELIEEDAAIIAEIKSLMAAEKLLKDELFTLAEQQKANTGPIVSRPLKVQRYSIF
ncbi:hypothetical protein [Pedobacter psychroterrae]|uniref:Uncharacterized protein n=1 Tax=Pedobacter psychroterrae TaxID=2530453 RepID=A0A4R0NL53_9SPHI|nr:hypothetical protein [Pedobacter psychroterrae]TCD01520.1 hypothetical protein EZ437_12350 [Pedobacter psychroterrae]